jgi:hypothetical protein
MATRTRSRPHRLRRLTVTFGALAAAAAWFLVAGYGDLAEQLLLWSLVAAPLAILAIAAARHAGDLGSALGGRAPDERHGPGPGLRR